MNLYINKLYQAEIKNLISKTDIPWDKLNNKSILITGATGMIGGYIIDVIMERNNVANANINIYAVSRTKHKLEQRFTQYANNRNFKIIEHNVEKSMLEKEEFPKNVDYIIHAASNTHPREYSADPVGTINTNILGTYNLAEYVRYMNNDCRLVILSSVEIYGENQSEIDESNIQKNENSISVSVNDKKAYFSENDMGYINCNTARAGYPESKRVSEAMMQSYINQYGIDSVIVRLSRIYGASLEEDDSKALTQFIKKSVNGENIILKSKGNQLYSYTYIADAGKAILLIMLNSNAGEAYNVADKLSDVRLRDIALYLAQLANTEVVFELPNEDEAKGYSTATVALLCGDKICKELNYEADYSIENGLKSTIDMLKQER